MNFHSCIDGAFRPRNTDSVGFREALVGPGMRCSLSPGQLDICLVSCTPPGHHSSSLGASPGSYYDLLLKAMPPFTPSEQVLWETFSPGFTIIPPQHSQASPRRPSKARFTAWSASERANALSQEVQADIQKASAVTQAKTGQIELYSSKFYGACILGGLLACVCALRTEQSKDTTDALIRDLLIQP